MLRESIIEPFQAVTLISSTHLSSTMRIYIPVICFKQLQGLGKVCSKIDSKTSHSRVEKQWCESIDFFSCGHFCFRCCRQPLQRFSSTSCVTFLRARSSPPLPLRSMTSSVSYERSVDLSTKRTIFHSESILLDYGGLTATICPCW